MGLGIAAAALFVVLSMPAVLARSAQAAQASDGPVIPAGTLASAYLQSSPAEAAHSVVSRIRIPELHIDAPIVEGIGDDDLRKGVGHVPGSAVGGGLGNMILAAHRDRIFRPLRSIRKGMDIQIAGREGTYHYQVDATEIVSPDRLDVLQIAGEPQVTLITCYPFNYIGSAPMRFIVKAHLVSVLPGPPNSGI